MGGDGGGRGAMGLTLSTTRQTPYCTTHLEVEPRAARRRRRLERALLERQQRVLQLLLAELGEQVARQQQLVVRERVGVVLAALLVDLLFVVCIYVLAVAMVLAEVTSSCVSTSRSPQRDPRPSQAARSHSPIQSDQPGPEQQQHTSA